MITFDDNAASLASSEAVAAEQTEVYKAKKRRPIGAILGAVWILMILGLTIMAHYFPSTVPFIRDYDVKVKINGKTTSYGAGPGWTAWWGLDKSAHDVFARCIYGVKVTLTVGVCATIIGLFFGGLLGLIGGYFRGWADRIVSIIIESLLAIPAIVIALLIVFRMDDLQSRYSWLEWMSRVWSITIALGLLAIAPLARIVRGQTLSLRERDFVIAARSLGASRSRIIVKEILPNLVPAMVTVAFTGLGLLIGFEGALAFLGLGVERPETWGKMIAGAQPDLQKAWWATIFPCIMLALTIIAFNLIGDEIARRFDIREAAV